MTNSNNERDRIHLAFVGAGSNRGDRLGCLGDAFERLGASAGIRAAISAPVYETRPIAPAGPGNFYNTVFRLEVTLSPTELWQMLAAIETELGRPPVRTDNNRSDARRGPRTIDLDLLLYDDLCLQTASLTIPHPRLHQRAFVLVPLADLAPHCRHPVLHKTVAGLLSRLPSSEQIIGRVAEGIVAPLIRA